MVNVLGTISEEEAREITDMLIKLVALSANERKLVLNSVNILNIRQKIEKQQETA